MDGDTNLTVAKNREGMQLLSWAEKWTEHIPDKAHVHACEDEPECCGVDVGWRRGPDWEPEDAQYGGLGGGTVRLPTHRRPRIRIPPSRARLRISSTLDGRLCKIKLQVMKVRKTLLSVGRVCDEVNRVVFERPGGCVKRNEPGDPVFLQNSQRLQHGCQDRFEAGFSPAGEPVDERWSRT